MGEKFIKIYVGFLQPVYKFINRQDRDIIHIFWRLQCGHQGIDTVGFFLKRVSFHAFILVEDYFQGVVGFGFGFFFGSPVGLYAGFQGLEGIVSVLVQFGYFFGFFVGFYFFQRLFVFRKLVFQVLGELGEVCIMGERLSAFV